MRKILVGTLIAVILGAAGALAQNRLGVGGSFCFLEERVTPVFDVFFGFPWEGTAIRFTLGIAIAPGENVAFPVEGSFLLTPVIEGFQPYLGGGVGGVAGGLGGVTLLTVHALGGAYFRVSETLALYAQVKLLGVLLGLITLPIGVMMPGFGLCVTF